VVTLYLLNKGNQNTVTNIFLEQLRNYRNYVSLTHSKGRFRVAKNDQNEEARNEGRILPETSQFQQKQKDLPSRNDHPPTEILVPLTIFSSQFAQPATELELSDQCIFIPAVKKQKTKADISYNLNYRP